MTDVCGETLVREVVSGVVVEAMVAREVVSGVVVAMTAVPVALEEVVVVVFWSEQLTSMPIKSAPGTHVHASERTRFRRGVDPESAANVVVIAGAPPAIVASDRRAAQSRTSLRRL
jgi:hypothetical protein